MRACNTIFILGLLVLPPVAHADAVLYHGFHHVDVTRHVIVADSWLIVDDGRITAMGRGETPDGFSGACRDLSDSWAIPGLIDGHAHITAGPHKVEIVDGQPAVTIESVDRITRYNALMALAYGITTVRNPGGDPEANARYDARIANGDWPGPTALHAGAVIQPPPFGGNAFAYPSTREGWYAEAERQAKLGMTYFKLYTSLTTEELAMGIEAAHAHGLQAIAHLDQVSWTTAIELGIDGLEHALPTSADLLPASERASFEALRPKGSVHLAAWFARVNLDGPEMQALFAVLAERGVTLNLTMLVNDMVAHADDLSAVIDAEAVATIHPANWAASEQFLGMGAAYWSDEDFAMARNALPRVREFARRVYEAGIPLLIGTDSNGGAALMSSEMALHLEAGLTPFEVLELATARSAAAMGLETTGRLDVGFEADIVFLGADPTADFGHLRDVRLVVVDGRAHDPANLKRRARRLLDALAPDERSAR